MLFDFTSGTIATVMNESFCIISFVLCNNIMAYSAGSAREKNKNIYLPIV
jgi:hypothetical protein